MLEILCLCQQRLRCQCPYQWSSNYLVYIMGQQRTPNFQRPSSWLSPCFLMWFTQLLVCQSGSAVHLPNSSSVWTKFCPFTSASVNWTVCQIRVASSLSLGSWFICYQYRDSCIPVSFPVLASQGFLNSLPSLNPG